MRLNLGCSDDMRGGEWINVDLAEPAKTLGGVFQQADLSLPWPWEDSSVEEIYAADIFEHILDIQPYGLHDASVMHRHWSGRIHVMNEAWRTLKPGGILHMECPDAAKGAGHFQDPQHVSPWTPNALQYYTDGSPAHKRFAEPYGITARFKVLGVTERMYREYAGDVNSHAVMCEVWKFTAIMECVK